MVRLLVSAALALGLSSCTAYNPRIASTSPDAVTVLYPEGERATAEKLAADECAKYGKRSRARTTTDRSQEKFAIFDCIT